METTRDTLITDHASLYDTTFKNEQFSILSKNSTLSRAGLRLEDVNKIFTMSPGEPADKIELKIPQVSTFTFGKDYFTSDVNLNQYIFEIIFGQDDIIALSINLIRICTTFLDKLANVTDDGLYVYTGDVSAYVPNEQTETVMSMLETVGRVLYFDECITNVHLADTQQRLLAGLLRRRYEKVEIAWNNTIQRDASSARVRIDVKVLIDYVRKKIPNLYSWLRSGDNAFGGQVNHVKTLLCGYYASRFGSPLHSIDRSITGKITYTLPNVKPRFSGKIFTSNTVGRSWAVAELLICFFRKYDHLFNTSVLLTQKTMLRDDDEYIPGTNFRVGVQTLTRSAKLGNNRIFINDDNMTDDDYEMPVPKTDQPRLPPRNRKRAEPGPSSEGAETR